MTEQVQRRVTRLDYCQFLLRTALNYTLTYFGEHSERFGHDAINRYRAGERITAGMGWENAQADVVTEEEGIVIFDDVVLDKDHSEKIELVGRQWSGNAKSVIKGMGVVTCVYVNPKTDQFWIIDYRIFAPDEDHKSKLDQMREMLGNAVTYKKLPFRVALMDTGYAAKDEMLFMERLGKGCYCPLKDNRKLYLHPDDRTACRVDALVWSQHELRAGRLVHGHGFPPAHQVKLFRLTLSTERATYACIVTNDKSQDWTPATQKVWDWRPAIEQFHRESKQLTGIAKCQTRKARIVRNHIGCAMLVWVRLHCVWCLRKSRYSISAGKSAPRLTLQNRRSILMCKRKIYRST